MPSQFRFGRSGRRGDVLLALHKARRDTVSNFFGTGVRSRRERASGRGTRGSVALSLFISLSFIATPVTFAEGEQGQNNDGAVQQVAPVEVPAPQTDGTEAETPPTEGTEGTEADTPPTQAKIQLAASPQGATGNPPVITVTKTLVTPGPFTPGQQFQYRIQYACSSLTTACPNATLTDIIPAELSFVTNTSTGDPSTITYDPSTRLLKVVFISLVDADGTLGLIAGHNGQLLVTATFPAGTVDGTTANNCAEIAADGAAGGQSCAAAESLTTPTYGVTLNKKYRSPHTGDTAASGVQGTGPTSTLDLSATIAGNQPASSVTVVDPDPNLAINNNPFDSFNLTGFVNPLSLPTGVQALIQVKSSTLGFQTVGTYTNLQSVTLPGTSGINAADVTGIQIVYTRTDAQPIAAGTTLGIRASVQLRNTLRSSGDAVLPGTVHNQAAVTATYPAAAPNQTDTDTADYTVIAKSPGIVAIKTISPATAQQNSGADVTMTVAGKNSGNLPANSMTVTDPDPTSTATPFATFTFKNFKPLTLPSGVTADVEVLLVPGGWTAVGDDLANGVTPSLGVIDAATVQGVRYIYTGTINRDVTISNSFVTTLKDSSVTGELLKVNCASASLTTDFGGGASQDGACVKFTVTAVSQSVTSSKSFSPASATAQTDATTTVTLGGKNTSNVPVSNFVIVDPGTGSDATFNSFNFTSFGPITAPAGTTWTVSVFDGTSWVASPVNYSTTQIPSLPVGVSAAQVQGVKYALASGLMPVNGDFSATHTLQLRDTQRSGGASIDSGSVKNCVTVSSSGATDSTTCKTFTINAISPGAGTGASKDIAASSVVQNTGATTNVTLKGRNDSNTPIDTVVIEDKDGYGSAPVGTFFEKFTFNGFDTTTRPSGTTSLTVEYLTAGLINWATVGIYLGTGNVTPSLPLGVTNADVFGVRYTWIGSFGPGTTVQAVFNAKLKDAAAAGSVKNCMQGTYDGLLISPVTTIVCDNITITPQTRVVERSKSFSPATGTLGMDPAATTTATLTVKNLSNVGIDSIVVTDPDGATSPFDSFDLTGFTTATMPANVRLMVEVSTDAGTNWTTVASGVANGGAIVTPANAADVTAVRLTYTATVGNTIPANSSAMSVGLKLVLRALVRGTETAVGATLINNCFDTSATTGAFTFTGNPCANFTPQAQSPGVSAGKTWIPASGVKDNLPSSSITIKGRNSGNVPVDSMVLQDPATVVMPVALATNAFDAFNVTGFSGLVLPQGADRVQIDVLTGDGTWHNGTPAATLPSGPVINGVALADIVGVRATFSNSTGSKLPVVTDDTKTGNVRIDVKLRSTLRSTDAPINVPPAGSLVVANQSNAVVVVNGQPSTPAVADAKYTITSGTVKVAPDKTLYPSGSSTDVNPNQSLIYQLQIKNTGDRNLLAPVVLDKFDPTLLGYNATLPYPGGSYQFVANGSSLTGTGLTVDTSVPGQVKFAFAPGDSLAPGQTAYIRIVLTTQPGLAAGTVVTNTYGITYDVTANGAVQCSPEPNSFVDGNATYCADSTAVKIIKAESMASIKKIKGDNIPFTNIPNPGGACPDVGGFTYYPCIAHTHVDGSFDYRLQITNSGNVPIGKARAIDVLPHVGDTGVLLTGQQRETQWTPTFISPATVSGLPASATYTLYYASTYTPCTTALSNNGGIWCNDWSTTDLGAATKAIAIDVRTVEGAPIPPAGSFTLHWKMKAPPVSPGVGSIAWNSFAFTGEPTGGSGWLLAAEPRKVGIDLVNPSVQVQKTTSPEGSDGKFEFTLSPVAPAVGGGTESVTTTGGTGSTTPWTNLTPGGTYTLTESGTAGDAPSFAAGNLTCKNGDADVPTTKIVGGVQFVAPANAVIVCSLTNTKRSSISVEKTSVGGDGSFDFTLTGDGGSTVPVETEDGSGSFTWGPKGLTPGGTYTLSETLKDGWVSTFTECTGVKPTSSTVSSVTFTAEPGAVISCGFTNTKRPSISVSKLTDGGDGSFDFTLTGDGGSTVPVETEDGSGSYTWGPKGLTPGGTYTLSESVQGEWVSTFVKCADVSKTSAEPFKFEGLVDPKVGATFTAPAGAQIECVFSNTKRPVVMVSKTTVGAEGGDFSFVLEGVGGSTQPVSVVDGLGKATWGPEGLKPGAYTLTEDTSTTMDGWVSEFTSCTNLGQSEDETDVGTSLKDGRAGVSLELVAGDVISCGFTNTKRPTISVEKTAVGGNGSFDFTLIGDGGSTVPVSTTEGSGSYTWGPKGLTPGGTYTLSETAKDGWSSSFTKCTGVTVTSSTLSSVTFTAEPGATISCGFTNTRWSTVSVEKTAVGGDGSFDFTLTGNNGSTVSVSTIAGSGSYRWGPGDLTPGGTYTLSEAAKDGWVSTFTKCTGVTPTSSTASSVTFTALPGATISCGFTNTKRPTISVAKTAVGGDGSFNFTLNGDGGSTVPVSTTLGAGSYSWGPAGLTPGGTYTLSEAAQDGWVSTFTSCSGVTPTSSTASSVTFTALPGATISCGFTNTKIEPPDEVGSSPSPPSLPAPPPDVGSGLPFTGGGAWLGITAIGLLLLTVGFLLLAGRRKRRTV